MSAALPTLSLLAGAYLAGSIPFALLLGRWHGVDIRTVGSGNVGATNLGRTLGRPWGIAAFVLDFLKGLLPVLVARRFLPAPAEGPAFLGGEGPALGAGLAAILGHVFPVYLCFRGGKGVATTFGVLAGLSWPATLVAAGVWGALYLWTRTVSIASMASAAILPLAVAFCEWNRPATARAGLTAFAVLTAVLILVRHRSNLRRLRRGEEPGFAGRLHLPGRGQ